MSWPGVAAKADMKGTGGRKNCKRTRPREERRGRRFLWICGKRGGNGRTSGERMRDEAPGCLPGSGIRNSDAFCAAMRSRGGKRADNRRKNAAIGCRQGFPTSVRKRAALQDRREAAHPPRLRNRRCIHCVSKKINKNWKVQEPPVPAKKLRWGCHTSFSCDTPL